MSFNTMNQRSKFNIGRHRLLHNALTFKRIELEIIDFTARESLRDKQRTG